MSETVLFRGDGPVAQPIPRSTSPSLALQLIDILLRERQMAEATLGRRLIDPYAFAADCLAQGLGYALNAEQDRIDELDQRDAPHQ
jgi:hypothetical protein